MFKNILVPLDGSANAEKIAEWSERLAAPFGSAFTLLTVVDPDRVTRPDSGRGRDRPSSDAHPLDQPPATDDAASGMAFETGVYSTPESEISNPGIGYGTQVIERVAQNTNTYLDTIATRLSASGFNVRSMVTVGSPADEILRVAKEQNIGLITMATHRESTLARGVLGSTTDRIIRSSPIPILTIRPEKVSESEPIDISSILVPLDGSDISETVVPLATEIARRTDTPLVFVRVSNLSFMNAMGDAGVYYASPMARTESNRTAREYLEPFVDQAKSDGVSASMRTPSGSVVGSLISVADENPNTLITMSSRGQTGFRRFVLGSVTDKMIRVSGHPVLVVPPAPV